MSDASQPRQPRPGWWRRLMSRLGGAPLSREALHQMLDEASRGGLIDPDAAEMIRGVFDTGELQVRDIMVPRGQMVVIERHWPLQRLLQTAVESGHSRFPVIGESRDEVVGILLAKDLLRCVTDSPPDHTPAVEHWLRPAVFVPESKRVNVLLREFKRGRNHMAIVADEYGGVAGLVTIEDVLETIVGEIEDEYDESESAAILKLDQRRYSVKGLTPIEDFNEYFKAEFSDEDFDTVAGLVVHAFGRMPRRGESVRIGSFQFNVLRAGSRRVDLLQVTLAPS